MNKIFKIFTRYSLKTTFFIAVLTPTLFMIITLYILDLNIYQQFEKQDHIRKNLIPILNHINQIESGVATNINHLFLSLTNKKTIENGTWKTLWQSHIFNEVKKIKIKNKHEIISTDIFSFLEKKLQKLHSTTWWIIQSIKSAPKNTQLKIYQQHIRLKQQQMLTKIYKLDNKVFINKFLEQMDSLLKFSHMYILSEDKTYLLLYKSSVDSTLNFLNDYNCNDHKTKFKCKQIQSIKTAFENFSNDNLKLLQNKNLLNKTSIQQNIQSSFIPLNISIIEIIKDIKLQILEKQKIVLINVKNDKIKVLYALTFTGIITIILALIFIYILKNNIINPLISLRDYIDMPESERKNKQLIMGAKNEIGSLATAFNKLITAQKTNKETIITQNKELLKRSRFDMLTELPNADYFKEYLTYQINAAKERNALLGLILIELKNIKHDNFSQHSVLTFAKILYKSLSKNIFCARYSENKFAIVVTDIEKSHEVLFFFKEIIFIMSKTADPEEKYILSQFTAGISTYPKDGNNYDSLVKNAMIALEKSSKSQIGEKISLYDVNVDAKYKKGSQLYEFLLTENPIDYLSILYQPLFSLDTNEIVSVEALLRLNHPDYKSLNTIEVINLLETMGKISEVDYWVIDQTMKQVEENKAKLQHSNFQISFNLSITDLSNKYFDLICQKASKSIVKNVSTKIEITETQFFESYDEVKERIYSLSQLNIPISIDDFGTGYASFSRLLLPNIKEIKIDQTFIKDLTINNSSYKIVKMIIDLSHNLGVKTVAEGIETREQVEALKALKCDIGQGFYFSSPLTFDNLIKLILKDE